MQMGYADVTNIRGGFAGLVDNTGRLIEPGWSALDLPTCDECNETAGYDCLAANARK
jgi:hypothetical protein